MTVPPPAALQLLLELLRPQVEGGRCAGCAGPLAGCGIEIGEVAPDRIRVTATCAGCGAASALQLRPASDPGGAATIR